jgi:RNA recognition motif-containing protein
VIKIYVGNLPFNVTDTELRALFEPYGSIDTANVVMDRDTGRSRGFGFVSMPNQDEAEKAMAGLNGKDESGRPLIVNEAKPQTQRSGSREGGGRRRDRNSQQRRGPRW